MSDTTIDHFCIYNADTLADNDVAQIDESYRADVEPILAAWIKKEDQEGRLRDRTLWKPMRDPIYCGNTTIMGYRHLFPFIPSHPPIHYDWKPGDSQYCPEEHPLNDGTYPRLVCIYFMLSLVWGCRDCSTCHNMTNTIRFVAGLYGWEESDTPYLKPHYYHIHPYETQRQQCKIIDRIWFAPPDDEDDDPNWNEEDEERFCIPEIPPISPE